MGSLVPVFIIYLCDQHTTVCVLQNVLPSSHALQSIFQVSELQRTKIEEELLTEARAKAKKRKADEDLAHSTAADQDRSKSA